MRGLGWWSARGLSLRLLPLLVVLCQVRARTCAGSVHPRAGAAACSPVAVTTPVARAGARCAAPPASLALRAAGAQPPPCLRKLARTGRWRRKRGADVLPSPAQGDGAGLLPGFVAPGLRVGEGNPRARAAAWRGLEHRPGRLLQTSAVRRVRAVLCSAPRAGDAEPEELPKALQRAAQKAGGREAPLTAASDGAGPAVTPRSNARDAQRGGGKGSFAYFPKLSHFDDLGKLLDAIAPFLDDSQGPAQLTGRNAAHVMNKLKSMGRRNARSEQALGAVAKAERARVEQVRARLMDIASEKMDELELKHIALVLNAVKGRRGSAEARLVEAACRHALELLEEEAHDGRVPAVEAQTVAMLVNSLAMGTGGLSATPAALRVVHGRAARARKEGPEGHSGREVMQRVFEASTRVLLAMPPESFDAQSISTTMNAYASAERWEVALFRQLGRIAINLGPERFSLQPVAMVMNAYSRLMQQVSALRSAIRWPLASV